MNRNTDVENDFIMLTEKKIDVMAILMKYIYHWKWFLLSIISFVLLAVVYIYFTLPQYEISSSILFKDDQKGGTTELNIVRDMGVVTRRNNVDNEIEIMKKSLIAENVVYKLHLYFSYTLMEPLFGLDNISPNFPRRKTAVLFGNEVPVLLQMNKESLNSFDRNISFDLVAYPNGNYEFSGKYKKERFNVNATQQDTIVRLPFGDIRLQRGELQLDDKMMLRVLLQPTLDVANSFLNDMDIELTSKNSSVANITLVTSNRDLGKNFLEVFIQEYNERGISDQLELAERTSTIIDNHLSNLGNELSSVEDQAQAFRQSRGLTDIASQADLYNSQLASANQRKMDIESQFSIVSSLLQFVQNKSGHNQLIPANSGVQSPMLNGQISAYNDLVLERNRLARIASSSNQSMIDLNNQLESTFSSVLSGLQNERNNLDIQLRDINTEYSRNNARIRAIPQQERAFSDIKRQQNIKEELFLYLLQKKEERYMNMTAVEANSKFVDNIRVTGIVWPNNIILLLSFFCFGLILPIIVIKIRDLIRYQLDNKEELSQLSSIPLLGEIPHTSQSAPILVKENNNDSFNEMLRLLRANLMFVVDGKENKVINVLSSISGEGKSFVSLNLAMSLALLDKKVVLIELDIRKPKLSEQLGIDNKMGITHYLSGYLEKQDLVKPSGKHPNLYVVTSGSVPPNPNELLAKPELDDFINDLRSEYDFIVIDMAPVGMVSDGFLLNRVADVNLYVTRAGFTPKKFVEDADRYFNENKLKKMYFILNSVDVNSVDFRYGRYKKYGYGYG